MRRNSTRDRRECLAAHEADFRCHLCGGRIDPVRDRWEAEHVVPLALGGTSVLPAHAKCHAAKTADDVGRIAKAKRGGESHKGVRVSARPMPGSRASGWKRRMDGTVERRR